PIFTTPGLRPVDAQQFLVHEVRGRVARTDQRDRAGFADLGPAGRYGLGHGIITGHQTAERVFAVGSGRGGCYRPAAVGQRDRRPGYRRVVTVFGLRAVDAQQFLVHEVRGRVARTDQRDQAGFADLGPAGRYGL